ncbi:MAG: alpha/beta fold hydrolase [Legionellales bacterium]
MSIHSTCHGRGIPLVLFHGWGFDSQIWLPLMPQLQEFYQIILVDLPGFGMSSMMDWPTFKNELLTLLPTQFVLAGWSLGGLYAMRVAIEAPARVMSLLSIASSPCFIANGIWPGVAKEVFKTFHQKLSTDLKATLSGFVALQANNKSLDFVQEHLPSQAGLESGLMVLDSWDLREALKTIAVPTCFIFGRLDRITPVKTMQSMQLLYPNFKYVLFHKSGHMPFLSQPEDFITEVLGLIQ